MQKIIFTDGTKTEEIYKVKSVNPFSDERVGVWSPDSVTIDSAKLARSAKLVPSVFAGVTARMQAMADLPFTIYSVKGDKPLDDSDNYKNIVGYLPNPASTFALTEGSLVNAGRAYWYKAKGEKTNSVKKLQYWIPSSVELDPEHAKKREIYFKRTGETKLFPVEEVLYTWLLDSNVELGAPTLFPLESAMIAAQASGQITQWVYDYMMRGAVKAMMLMVKDGMPPPGEVERIENFFNRFMRGMVKQWKVFNGASIEPTIIGDGLEALKDLSITKELRYEIHTALGTRHLLEDENYATAIIRQQEFILNTIVPNARLIQYSHNEQILHAQGQHIEFEPQRLEIFQKNASETSKAFVEFFTVLKETMSVEAAFQLASEKLDYQFTDEQKALIKKGIEEKKNEVKPIEVVPVEDNIVDPKVKRLLVELDRWEAKSTKAGKIVTWHAIDLSVDMVKAIKSGELTFTQAREQINASKMLFAPQVQSEAALVLAGIRLALSKHD